MDIFDIGFVCTAGFLASPIKRGGRELQPACLAERNSAFLYLRHKRVLFICFPHILSHQSGREESR